MALLILMFLFLDGGTVITYWNNVGLYYEPYCDPGMLLNMSITAGRYVV